LRDQYFRSHPSWTHGDEDGAMHVNLGGALRLAFRSAGDRSLEVVFPDAVPIPRIEFVAYGEECILSGRIPMGAERLTDVLNQNDTYELVDVSVERLSDGVAMDISGLIVSRNELLLVLASGPRGNHERRRRKRQHPVAMQLGSYQVRGYLHALPGVDPVSSIRSRKPMIPLTDAWIEFESAAGPHRQRFQTVLVNRDQIEWIVPLADGDVELRELPLETVAAGPRGNEFAAAILEAGRPTS
jgi:hypothetical protein